MARIAAGLPISSGSGPTPEMNLSKIDYNKLCHKFSKEILTDQAIELVRIFDGYIADTIDEKGAQTWGDVEKHLKKAQKRTDHFAELIYGSALIRDDASTMLESMINDQLANLPIAWDSEGIQFLSDDNNETLPMLAVTTLTPVLSLDINKMLNIMLAYKVALNRTAIEIQKNKENSSGFTQGRAFGHLIYHVRNWAVKTGINRSPFDHNQEPSVFSETIFWLYKKIPKSVPVDKVNSAAALAERMRKRKDSGE